MSQTLEFPFCFPLSPEPYRVERFPAKLSLLEVEWGLLWKKKRSTEFKKPVFCSVSTREMEHFRMERWGGAFSTSRRVWRPCEAVYQEKDLRTRRRPLDKERVRGHCEQRYFSTCDLSVLAHCLPSPTPYLYSRANLQPHEPRTLW